MAGVERGRTRGFWRGLLTGAALAAAVALGLAIAFPPTIFHDPEVLPEAQVAPEKTAAPGPAASPEAPEGGSTLLRQAAAPLIAERPAADVPPALEALAPAPAPDVFDGGPAGSPTLAPLGE